MKRIEKKILPEYYMLVRHGQKNFELRKDEDDIQIDDVLILREWKDGRYTGRALEAKVAYVLRDCPQYGLMEGYCIIGLGSWIWIYDHYGRKTK